MIIEVPFVFTRSGSVAGSRSKTTESLIGNAPVRLREIRSEEAPVAARASYEGASIAYRGNRPEYVPNRFQVDYRLVNGRLARRAVPDAKFLTGRPAALSRALMRPFADSVARWSEDSTSVGPDTVQDAMRLVAAAVPIGAREIPLRFPTASARTTGEAKPEALGTVVRNVEDDRSDRLREVVRSMTGAAAMVDGALYMPSWGPCWTVRPDYRGPGADLIPEASWVSRSDLLNAYLAQDVGACRAAAGCEPAGAVEVLLPSAFMHPDELAARAVASIVCGAKAAAALADKRSYRGLVALADVMKAVDSDTPCMPAAAEAFRDLGETLEMAAPGYDGWRSRFLAAFGARSEYRNLALAETFAGAANRFN